MKPLLGADFSDAQDLCVDFEGRCILRFVTVQVVYSIPAPVTNANSSALSTRQVVKAAGDYQDLLDEFPEVQRPRFGSHHNAHVVAHTVPTKGPPVFVKARRLCLDRLACTRAAFDKLLANGIVRRSDSPWSSPLHMVPKSDGSWRPCGDFRQVNEQTDDDRYPLPHIQDFGANLQGRTVFSVLDLQRSYHQVPMDPKDIKKTAIITQFCLFEYLYMPSRMKNSAQAVQRLMDQIFKDLPYTCLFGRHPRHKQHQAGTPATFERGYHPSLCQWHGH